MEYQLHRVAALALIDERLEELHEEFGDLPQKVKDKEKKVLNAKTMVEETKEILEKLKFFVSNAKNTLTELKAQEETLSKQQFAVRNNKEFDAITAELASVKQNQDQLSTQLSKEIVKEDNLAKLLVEQEAAYEQEAAELKELEKEIRELSIQQDDEVAVLYTKRDKVYPTLDEKIAHDYVRIRTFHRDAAVQIKRNSCSGCFSSIPSQIIVEVRNNLNTTRFCENCGRIIIPEEFVIDDELLNSI